MRQDQFEHIVHAFLRRRPFRPFMLELSSGTRIRVHRPEAFAMSAGMVSVLDRKGYPHYFDEGSVVHVTREMNGQGGNGASRRQAPP